MPYLSNSKNLNNNNNLDKEELKKIKAKIEENLIKIADLNNTVILKKREEKLLQKQTEGAISPFEYQKIHNEITNLKESCQNLALVASRCMRLNNELIERRNALIEKISLQDFLLKQGELKAKKSAI